MITIYLQTVKTTKWINFIPDSGILELQVLMHLGLTGQKGIIG